MSGRALGLVLGFVFLATSTSSFAGDETQAVASPAVSQAANMQVASVNPVSLPATQAVASADPLHSDARWPLFKNCIDNTATQAAFQGCLQMAFMGVKPDDKVLALLMR